MRGEDAASRSWQVWVSALLESETPLWRARRGVPALLERAGYPPGETVHVSPPAAEVLMASGQLQQHVMLRDRQATHPKRIRLGSPGDKAKRLVERPRSCSIAGNAESHRVDARPCSRVMHAGLDHGASKSAATMAGADIHAPDARSMLLLRSRFPNDARHYHESVRLVRIGDREDGAVGIREIRIYCGKLAEAAFIGVRSERGRLRGKRLVSEGLQASGVFVGQSPCVVHGDQYPSRSVRSQLNQGCVVHSRWSQSLQR
mgnify:CR=1 FL=1